MLLYDPIRNMREDRARPLLTRFGEFLRQHALLTVSPHLL
jgi:hypothetical protein